MEFKEGAPNLGRDSKMPTSSGLEFDAEGLNDFRKQVGRLSIRGLNPLHLTGEDMKMWRKFKMKTMSKKEFQDYYSEVENDKISNSLKSVDRYLFATYIFTNAKFE